MKRDIIDEAGDIDGLVEMLFEAALTERRLSGVLKKRYKVVWPDIPPDPNLAFGYNQARLSLGSASAAEIDRYDRMLLATQILDGEDAKICGRLHIHRSVGKEGQRGKRSVVFWGLVRQRLKDVLNEQY